MWTTINLERYSLSTLDLGIIIGVLVLSSALAYWIGTRKAKSIDASDLVSPNAKKMPPTIAEVEGAKGSAVTTNAALEIITICNDAGAIIVQSNEIAAVPTYGRRLALDSPVVQQAAHLAADIFKGAISLPGRSINIVFKPPIQAGLEDGTYTLFKTTIGETLADAVDSSGKIVGKGRIVETGKVRQLASGAFQLASIVVGQVHLADIERSLMALRNDLKEVRDDQESRSLAEITGKHSYLSSLLDHLSQLTQGAELSPHMANSVQHIVLESHTLRDKLYEDLNMLITRIRLQNDPDTVGTEGVYSALRSHLDNAENLLIRHEKLVQLMAILNYVITVLDPTGKHFFRADINAQRWGELCKELEAVMTEKAEKYLSKARFNAEDTLRLRKKDIARDTRAFLQNASFQQTAFDDAMRVLAQNNGRYFGNEVDTHIALSFGRDGKVNQASVL